MAIEEKQQTFKGIQEHYDHLFKVEPIRDEDRAYRWFAEQLFKVKPGMLSLLDLACGAGYFLREVAKLHPGGVLLSGTDISGTAIEMAKQECPQAEYTLAVAEDLPFEDRTFDAVTCLGSMEHFLDIGKAIREMKRVSKPDAVFFILVPNMFWYKDIWSVLWTGNRKTRNQMHERFASRGEWIELFQNQGLRVTETIKYNGIAKRPFKQRLKDMLIPQRFSYHFLFICRQ